MIIIYYKKLFADLENHSKIQDTPERKTRILLHVLVACDGGKLLTCWNMYKLVIFASPTNTTSLEECLTNGVNKRTGGPCVPDICET